MMPRATRLRATPLHVRCTRLEDAAAERFDGGPVTPNQLTDCTATDLLALYRSGQASPVEATQAVLARIERLNPKLLAYCHVAPEDAVASARASEARWSKRQPIGALDGVPTSIKDLILTKGWPTLRGS